MKENRKFTKSEEKEILAKCTDKDGNTDISFALLLAYTAGRRDQEKEMLSDDAE